MGLLREGTGRFEARLAPRSPSLARASLPGLLGGLRWRWIFPAGAAAALLSFGLMRAFLALYVLVPYFLDLGVPKGVPPALTRTMSSLGLPLLHLVLTFAAASVVARRARAAPRRHGLMVGLVSVTVSQAVGLHYGPLLPGEAAFYLVLSAGGGLLGAERARRALAGREALYAASLGIGAASGASGIVAAIGEHLAEPEDEGVSFWRPEGGTGDQAVFVPVESWPKPGRRPSMMRLDGPRGDTPAVVHTRELADPEREAWYSEGIRSALLVPLVVSGGVNVGLLVVSSRKGRRFSKGTVRAYGTIGTQAALALENLRLVDEARRAGRQAGVLRERQRLAHEIHDTLAQGFTSIVMNLEAAEEKETPASEPARRHLEGARQAAREGLAEARRLVWALRPESLDRRSLAGALEGLSGGRPEDGVSVRVSVTGAPRALPPEAEVALFRVAQEALGNVRKHARAERAAVTLSYMDDLVVLDVLDDGRGFEPSAPKVAVGAGDAGGFGLRSMRERVEGLGGRLLVESSPGGGTSLTAELPTKDQGSREEVL